MSPLLQIRGVPEPVRQALKARAAARGTSLNSYVLSLLTRETERPPAEEVLTRALSRSERSPVSALDTIQAARNERTAYQGRGST